VVEECDARMLISAKWLGHKLICGQAEKYASASVATLHSSTSLHSSQKDKNGLLQKKIYGKSFIECSQLQHSAVDF
jgi:hypothetical protein